MSADPAAHLNAALAGRYEVTRQLGEGGMATVYLARDLKHERNVALKVLKPSLAAAVGADRFLAEIKTTANLHHPHILPLFDSGQADSFLFYVMPYVEGESLQARLDRERQLPVDEAVRIASQVAEALEHAHALGVVHRDVKPANILLHQGNAIVADFGIALAVGAASRGRLTETGLTPGTPIYMSPEQAAGDPTIASASDVWSLGCVLYEMLVGEPPFVGRSAQAILGRIVTGEAEPVTARRRTTPANVASAVARSLEKVPSDRFRSGGEFASALADPRFRHGPLELDRRRWAHMAGAAALAFVLGMGTWAALGIGESAAVADPIRFIIPDIGGSDQARSLALSRDGVYLAEGAGGRLTVRRVDDSERVDTLVTGVVNSPFFSPDGASIAYFAGVAGDLVTVSRTGGLPRTIARGAGARPRGGTWGEDGTIVWATTAGLYRVSQEGGDVVPVAAPDAARGELEYAWPTMLPGRSDLLFTVVPAAARSDREASIARLDLGTGGITVILAGGSSPEYLASGHLLYSAEGTLNAVEFDAESGVVGGERVDLGVNGLSITAGWGANYDVSPEGTLAYLPSLQSLATLVWLDRNGREEPLPLPPGGYGYLRISPDGGRIAYDRWLPGGGPTRDLYVWDLQRGVETRLTDDPGEELFGEWSEDGDTIYYSGQSGGAFHVRRRLANGSGPDEAVYRTDANLMLSDVSADGGSLFAARAEASGFDVLRLTLGNPVREERVVSGPASEFNAFGSPDGRFYVYQSDRDGQFEIWVNPVDPSRGGPVKVSVDGGVEAGWSPAGDEIYYLSRQGQMMAAAFVTSPRVAVGRAVALFTTGDGTSFGRVRGRHWDVSPLDGRFLTQRYSPTSEGGGQTMLGGARIVLNWGGEVRRLMGR